jgi:hypothetical protein
MLEEEIDDCELVIRLIESNPDEFIDQQNRKRKRQRRPKIDLWQSEWGRLLKSHQIANPNSWEAKKFRLRFRVPWPLFLELVRKCRKEDANIFNSSNRSNVPIEFKILVSLRILGRDTDTDTVSELSGLPQSTSLYIFKDFCSGFVKHFYTTFVYFPIGEELQQINDVFSKVGFPGACGSMDVTHFRWDRCPTDRWNFFKGKYPFPTVAVQAIVDHNRRIMYLSDLFPGRENDKTITVNDDFTHSIIQGRLQEVIYTIFGADGIPTTIKGGYIIVDGGYHKYPVFIDPDPLTHMIADVRWSEFLESIRKDVECTFGILKKRFRILRNGITYGSLEDINNIVKTCAMLHNMLLAYDNMLTFEWESNADWGDDDPDMNDLEILNHIFRGMDDNSIRNRYINPPAFSEPIKITSNSIQNHRTLKFYLSRHFHFQYSFGLLSWPRRFHSISRRLHPLQRIAQHIQEQITTALYVKPTDLRLYDAEGNVTADNSIGDGLFCSIDLPSHPLGIKLGEYKGNLITASQKDERIAQGKGGYILIVHHSTTPYLDCYDSRRNQLCKMSCANRALNCFNVGTNRSAVLNCDIKINGHIVTLWTKKNTLVHCHKELLVGYGRSYSRVPI